MPRTLPYHWEPSPEGPGPIPPPPRFVNGPHKPHHVEINEGLVVLQDNLEFVAEKIVFVAEKIVGLEAAVQKLLSTRN